ncbi:hypothetical protein K458DRAFT_410409 [Lentithecium fluviatile CBS 122367]|uniref:PD-(D/E)XK nuclease-like domain-containing protein n=1 Tax=Lentithecium fluviatile CBS 122367 TaxID=1168545 RepID=A0A6G1IEQ7_9PLEO|nr:hypothetical protein K458DRAFT_410409 [Lentithecium fluviatile CBS 122367]
MASVFTKTPQQSSSLTKSLRSRSKSSQVNVRDIDAESKLVDFALIAVLVDPRNGISSISHTTYERVRLRPICVSIETKTPDGKESTALVQLSLWVTTHFNRLPPAQRNVIPMPLPLITTVGGRYSLFFAIDGEDEVRIVGGESDFGNTATLEGCACWIEKSW